MAQHVGEQFRRHPVGKHVGGGLVAPDLRAKERLQFARQAEVGIGMFRRRRAPLFVAARQPLTGMADRNTADGGPLQSGAARVTGFGDAIHQHRSGGPLAAAGKMQHRPGRAFVAPDLLLQQHQTLQKGFGARRTAGDVDIDRQELIDPLYHAVDVIHPAGVGAAPHGDDPARLGHLFVQTQDVGGHLAEGGAGNHHQIGLARGAAQYLGPEAGDVVARGKRGHHLDETAGKPEEHRPERVGAPPVDQVVQVGQ